MDQVSGWLIDMLQCPVSRMPVVRDGDWVYSTDSVTRRRYPIREGIPEMLIDESEVVSREEFLAVMDRTRDQRNSASDSQNIPVE